MTRGIRRWGVGVALVAALAACGADEDPEEAGGATTRPPAGAASGVIALPERQPTRDGMITIEGTTEPKRFVLYRTPEGFPLPFSTYLPDDMQAEAAAGEEVRIVAAFGGTPNPAARVSVRAYPEGMDEAGARAMAEQAAAALGAPVADEAAAEEWALDVRPFRGADGTAGRLHLGEHAGRYFEVVIVAPAEMLDGFGPRVAHVLDEWRWEDTGEGLRREIRY